MNILITGGAGYVGSIVTEEFLRNNHHVTVLDNMEQGHKEAVLPDVEFISADIRDRGMLDNSFSQLAIDAVVHLAAETVVEYSMTDPRRYLQTNVLGGMNLLDTMLAHNVNSFIFSSTAAVYGEPQSIPMTEDHPRNPVNAYGESKLIFERILEWYNRAYGLKYISFRYFNAAGASELLGEDHYPETHLIPNILKAAFDKINPVTIFGTDYPTKDGSCIRDYVHVVDIAQAHTLALEKLERLSGNTYNLGSGKGYSIIEVIEVARKVTGIAIPVKSSLRRLGDPAVLVASSSRAKADLGWQPKFPELASIIDSAWNWTIKHPNGYEY